MGVDTKLLLEIADQAGIDDEIAIFEALGFMAGQWQTLARDIDGVDSALELLGAITAGAQNEGVAAAFKALGADKQLTTLQAAATRLDALLDHPSGEMMRLLDPVGRFDETSGGSDHGLVTWSIGKTIGASNEASADKPSYALSLGAEASLTLEAGAQWPHHDVVPGPLLRLGAAGSLKPKASSKLPFSGGSVSASASASAACAIEYYFAVADPATPYALAAAQRLGDLVDPFDFDAVWNGITRNGLMGLHYTFDGSAAVDVSVSLADAGALAAGIKAEIGATISMSVGLEGHYFLTFRAGPRGANGLPRVDAVLSREKKSSLAAGFTLGGSLDLSSLARRLHAILKTTLDAWDSALKEIVPFLSPGTLLRTKAGPAIDALAKDLLKDAALAKALASDLNGVIGTGEPETSELAAWLSDRLEAGLDAAQAWTVDQAAAADRMVDALGRSLPAFAQAQFKGILGNAAQDLIGKANDALREKVKALFDANAKQLGKALKDMGVVADKKLADLDEALAGVRALVERYDRFFRKVLAETENAARAKLSITLQVEETRVASQAIEIEGSFVSDGKGARAAFRALTRGEFVSLIRMMDSAGKDGFVLNPARSSLKRFAGGSSKFGSELVLFGIGASASELMKGEAEIVVDGTGAVQVGAKGSLLKRFFGLDAEREITLVSTYSLVRARALATAPAAADRSMGLAITVGHNDKRLERHEVDRFVGSLVGAGLAPASAQDRAQDVFRRWAGSSGSNARLVANVQLKLALDRASLGNLLFLASGPAGLGELERRKVVRQAYDAVIKGVNEHEALAARTIAFLDMRDPKMSLDDRLMDHSGTERELKSLDPTPTIKRVPREHEPFVDAMQLAHGQLKMIKRLREIYFSTPELREDNDPASWSPANYRDAEQDAVGAVRSWLQLNNMLFWTNSKVHPRTLAFLQTIAALARIDPAQCVSLTMWRKGADERPETVVLTHSPALP